MTNRRQFERLHLEGASAYDDTGRELGQVFQVGGGGMGIELIPAMVGVDFPQNKQMRVIVVETTRGLRHAISVQVRFVHGRKLGVLFLTAPVMV